MTNDFFLVERAVQVQRLRAAPSGNRIEIPGTLSRLGCSRQTKELFQTIDRICQIPLGEKRKSWLKRMTERGVSLFGVRPADEPSPDEPKLLTPQQRMMMLDFDRQLMQLQLGEDAEGAAIAGAIVTAILLDHHSFSGLKPLPFHSEKFAYEFLFPSWLNLYTALMLPQTDSDEPRFTDVQIKTIFRFLNEVEDGGTPKLELVGAFTMAANRLPPLEAQQLIQRLVDLCYLQAQGSNIQSTTRLCDLRWQAASAMEFLELLNHLTIFETCTYADQIVATYQIGSESPQYEALPESLTKRVQALADEDDQFAVWTELIGQIGRIVDAGSSIDNEFANVLQRKPDPLTPWLALVLPPENAMPLSRTCQRFLALLIQRAETQREGLEAADFLTFALQMAPRLDMLVGPMATFFRKEFIQQDKNRELLLKSTEDHSRRRTIAQQLLKRAQKTDDSTHLLSHLTVAAIFDPDYDLARLAGFGRTVTVLRLLQEQGFISSNQLEELSNDIRQRLPDSMQFLVAPHLGASDRSGRLAKLYLALYEECEKFELLGETGNFGLTTAAYGNLNRAIDQGNPGP